MRKKLEEGTLNKMDKDKLNHIRSSLEQNDVKTFEEIICGLNKNELYEYKNILSSDGEDGDAQSANTKFYNDDFSTACSNIQSQSLKTSSSSLGIDDFSKACKTEFSTTDCSIDDSFSKACNYTHNDEYKSTDHTNKTLKYRR